MKSKTSFFNGTVFRKDLTRFAPAWGIYSVILLLAWAVLMAEATPYYRASNVADLVGVMAIANLVYAFLNAQLLFGDLFSSRMCNALHAMPMRRECWYATHLVSGIAFSLIPNLAVAALGMATMNLGKAWAVPLYWLLGSSLQYACFLGMATLCVMLTGNRFAATVVYGLVNFFSMLIFWLADSLYEPLLPGIRIREDFFVRLSPVVNMMAEYDLVDVLRVRIVDEFGYFEDWVITGISLGDGWRWLWVYALAGAAFLVLGLVLYRRRKLECAGDFMAFRASEPVLLVVYTVTVGGIFHLFSDLFSGGLEKYLFLAVGLAVGYFTGLMLLQRTTRVFRLKTFAGFVVLAAVLGVSLGLTALDPIGITRWVPAQSKVESVTLSNRYTYNGYSQRAMELTRPEDIQAILDAHEYQIGRTTKDEFQEFGSNFSVTVCLEYTLKNGKTVTRFYDVNTLGDAGKILQPYFSSFPYVTEFEESRIPELAGRIFQINSEEMYISEKNINETMADIEDLDVEALLRAIAADCAAGNMAQFGQYHLAPNEEGYLDWDRCTYVEIGYYLDESSDGTHNYLYLNVYRDAVNTLKWMEDNGLYNPEHSDVNGK